MAMKKTILTLSVIAFALVACNKEVKELEPVDDPEVIEQAGAVLSFTSDRPQTEVDPTTKTAWDNVNSAIVWTSGDRIKVGYTLDGTWMSAAGVADLVSNPKVPAKFYASTNVTIDGTHANVGTFSVPSGFTNSPSGEAIFYGVYPQSCTDTDSNYAPSLTVNIPTSQTPGAETFDGSADIMVGQTEATTLSGSFPDSPLAMTWNRIVAHADITFKNLGIVDDTSVDKITLTFNSEAKVVGTIYMNVTTGLVTNTSGAANVVEIRGDNLSISGTSIEAWACVLPTDFTSVDVEVKTDVATYTRSITGISMSFKKNARNTLGINMSTATRTLNSILIPDGNYVLALKSVDDYYAISSAANGTSRRDEVQIKTVGFDPVNYSALSPYTAANNIIWTITNVTGGVKINLAGDTNSYMQYGNNTLPLGAEGAVFEVAEGTDTYTFKNSDRYISRNAGYGFGCYASYPKDFYVVPATGTPTITFAETSKTVAADVTPVTFTYTGVFLASAPTVTVTSDAGSAVSSTSIADGTLTVNMNENKTSSPKSVTLTVSATGAGDVVLTITQAGVVPDASNGTVLWTEAFSGFSNNAVPAASNAITIVYGSGTVNYSVGDGGGTTKVYGSDNTAGGVAPELLIAKDSGYLTASDIPTGNATGMTLTFKSNNDNVVVSSSTDGSVISYVGKSGKTYTYGIAVPAATKTLALTFTNNAGASTNIRIDDITLTAGAPSTATPVISFENNTVTITCGTAGASIYYTDDGTTPDSGKTLYSAPFELSSAKTIKAIAIKDGLNDSEVVELECTPKVATPVISCSANAFTITCDTDGATIYYEISTTDLASVATPTTSSSEYSVAVDYAATTYVKAYAIKDGYTDSDVESATCTYSSGGGTDKTYTITWNSTNNSKGVSSYTDNWSVTASGLTCDMGNFNNYNNGWDYVKCGRKNNASVATISTQSAIAEAIKTVTITIDAVTADKINSIKLYISDNGSAWTEEASFTVGTGDKYVTVGSPAANKYYKLVFDCASGSSNGLLTLSKLVFTTK